MNNNEVDFYNYSTKAVPCVYLITLGTIKDLRESIKLSDVYNIYSNDMIVCNYGITYDLQKCIQDHDDFFWSPD